MRKKRIGINDFWFGFILGMLVVILITGIILGIIYSSNKKKELLEYAEKQIEIEELRKDYSDRNPNEFLEIPDVRRANDGAKAEFERKRDEAVQRFRSRMSSRARLAD